MIRILASIMSEGKMRYANLPTQWLRHSDGAVAVKAISVVKDGVRTAISKDPKTDTSKKSAKGLLRVVMENGKLVQYDQQTEEQEKEGLLQTVFLNGNLVRRTTLQEIRSLVKSQIEVELC